LQDPLSGSPCRGGWGEGVDGQKQETESER
jgi:hypothetical protein